MPRPPPLSSKPGLINAIAMSMNLPPVTELIAQLAAQMRPHVTPDTVLVGIHTGGVWAAEALHAALGLAAPLATIDVSFHRDDHHIGSGLKSGGRASHLPDNVEGAHLILVDDVLYTGRTIRAALERDIRLRPAGEGRARRTGRSWRAAAAGRCHVLPARGVSARQPEPRPAA